MVATSVLVLGLLGLVAAVVWDAVVTPAEYTKIAAGPEMGELQLGRQFGADAWFVLIGFGVGLAAGLVLAWWHVARPLVTSVAVLVGAVIAAAVMAQVGHLLGPPAPATVLATAKVGTRAAESLDVGVGRDAGHLSLANLPVLLSWPVGGVLGTLLALLLHGPSDRSASAD